MSRKLGIREPLDRARVTGARQRDALDGCARENGALFRAGPGSLELRRHVLGHVRQGERLDEHPGGTAREWGRNAPVVGLCPDQHRASACFCAAPRLDPSDELCGSTLRFVHRHQ